MDYGFAPGVTPWEAVMRQMLERRRDTRSVVIAGKPSVMDFFRHLRSSNVTADDLIVGSHATNEGVLFLDLDALNEGRPATFEVLEAVNSSGTIEIPAGIRSSTTRFHVKGCRIGADECRPYLTLLKKALGNPKQVTAPKFFHGLYPAAHGIFEWMGHSYQIKRKEPLRTRQDLVAAFQNERLTRLDGKTRVEDAEIEVWVRQELNLQPQTMHQVEFLLQMAIVPRTGSLSTIDNIGARCRAQRETHTYVHSGAGAPKTEAELKKLLQAQREFEPTHPYPLYKRLLYPTFDDFFAGQTWRPARRPTIWVGTHFVYTLIIPVARPATPPAASNELIFNFYPTTGAPTMNFLEDNTALFGQV